MSTPISEPPTASASATESKPQAQPSSLSWAARAKQTLPPSAISADLPTPISTPGKSINAPSSPNPTSSGPTKKEKAAARAARSSRPERAPNGASTKNSSGRNPNSKSGSAKHHGGGGGDHKEHKARASGAHASKEAGASKTSPAVEGAPAAEGEAVAPVDETPVVPPPARKPAPLPTVNPWKTRADAVKPADSPKEGGNKSKKNNTSKSTSTPSPEDSTASASVDPSHPSFPSLADAPAPASKRSSSRPRPSQATNGESQSDSARGGEEGAAGTSAEGGKAGKKEKKTRWVAIPPSELQISVDLAAERSKKNRVRRPEDASNAPAPRAAKKKAAAPTSTPSTTTNPSTSAKKSAASKKADATETRPPTQSTAQSASASTDAGVKQIAGSAEGAPVDGEADPLASLAASMPTSMPTPSRQAHQLPGVSLGIEGMMRKDEEVVEISSEVERSLLRSAADARSNNPNLFSPPSPEILPFDLQAPPILSSSSSATGDASSSAFRSGTQPSSIASDVSSKPLHTPAPKVQVTISAPPPDYVPTKPPAGSASRSSRGAYSSRGGPAGRGAPRGGMGGPGSFTNRNNPFAAPFYQMQQQGHVGGPLPAGATAFLTSPPPLANGGPLSPSQAGAFSPLPSTTINGAFSHHNNAHHSSGAGSFVPAARRPSQASALPNGHVAPNHFSHAPPPMPLPVTIPNPPVDPLRYYLLGQLEYYFGAQNLAMDFFLRQQMDSQGFVSIPLVATFNRIKNLTSDLSLVREMLALSQLVEVKGDRVRLANRGWVQWVLPGAAEANSEVVAEVKEAKKEAEKEEEKLAEEEVKAVVEEVKAAVVEEEETQDEKDEREVEAALAI